MRPIRNRVRFLTKFQIVSVLLKIAPYHMQKFGRYRKSSYLCIVIKRKISPFPFHHQSEDIGTNRKKDESENIKTLTL